MTSGIDLDGDKKLYSFVAKTDQAVEVRFPTCIAGEIIIGYKKGLCPFPVNIADVRLQVLGRACSAFSSLYIDDTAEITLERTASSQIDTGHLRHAALYHLFPEIRKRGMADFRHRSDKIIQGLHGSRPAILQQPVQTSSFQLTSKKTYPLPLGGSQFRGHLLEHGKAA